MFNSVEDLRKKARHCRELAKASRKGPVQNELAKMADEFDEQAAKLERKTVKAENK